VGEHPESTITEFDFPPYFDECLVLPNMPLPKPMDDSP
jgi:hypothetical protein